MLDEYYLIKQFTERTVLLWKILGCFCSLSYVHNFFQKMQSQKISYRNSVPYVSINMWEAWKLLIAPFCWQGYARSSRQACSYACWEVTQRLLCLGWTNEQSNTKALIVCSFFYLIYPVGDFSTMDSKHLPFSNLAIVCSWKIQSWLFASDEGKQIMSSVQFPAAK